MVLTASRLPQRLDEAPAAVTVIDREMIRDSGARDLPELFRFVPGMWVAYHASNVYTTNTSVSYHGLSDAYAHRMQVLVDGRSVYSPLFGGVVWADLPLVLDDIERIEVTRGPNSASYGANSFLGVINIITRHSAETQGRFLSLTAGQGLDELVGRYGGRSGDFTWRGTASARNDAGEASSIVGPVSSDALTNKHDDKRIRLLALRGDYRLSARDEMELQFGYNGGDRQEGFDTESFFPRTKRVENHFELVHWRRALDGGDELGVQFYHSYESTNDTLYPVDPRYANLLQNADVIAQRYDLEAQHIVHPSASTRLVWGGSVRLDKTYWPLYLNRQNALPFHLARLFGNLEWHARRDLLVNVGAMAEKNDFTGTDVTPRAAVNWHFVPGHTLRVSYSTATRTPTLYEEKTDNRYRIPTGAPAPLPSQADYIVRYAQGGLRPEHIASAEVGYLMASPLFDVDVRLFRDRLTDLIASVPYNPCNPSGTLPTLAGFVIPPYVPPGVTAPGIACYATNPLSAANTGAAVVKGVETQLHWRPTERTRLIYSFAHIHVSGENEASGQPYSRSAPTDSQSLLLSHQFDQHWRGSLAGYQVGTMQALGGADSVSGYTRWDGRVAYGFRTPAGGGELALVVQNLADAHYFEYDTNNQPPGRTPWLTLKLDL